MMTKKQLQRFFPLLVIFCLVPLPIAYAYDIAGQEAVRVTAADSQSAPNGIVFGRAIGNVNPGDLFYINATGSPADIVVTLSITNALEVSHYLSYLILKVGIYAECGNGEWESIYHRPGGETSETFITLASTQVSFELPGNASYKVTIEGGSFYAMRLVSDRNIVSPRFYLRVD